MMRGVVCLNTPFDAALFVGRIFAQTLTHPSASFAVTLIADNKCEVSQPKAIGKSCAASTRRHIKTSSSPILKKSGRWVYAVSFSFTSPSEWRESRRFWLRSVKIDIAAAHFRAF